MENNDYCESDETFVNPYYFIKLEDSCSRESWDITKLSDLKTGWIEIELKTLTPIFIPNTTNDDFFEKRDKDPEIKKEEDRIIRSYDFYSYENLAGKVNPMPPENPVIPGSEIRGMIRNVFEPLTNSCLSSVNSDDKLSKRVTTPAKLVRIIKENGKWYYQNGKRYRADNRDYQLRNKMKDFKEGQKVYFHFEKRGKGDPKIIEFLDSPDKKYFINLEKILNFCNNLKKGYFHCGEKFENPNKRSKQDKKYESVLVLYENDEKIEIKNIETLKNLFENYKIYNEANVNLHLKTQHTGYKKRNLSTYEDLDGKLAYYSEYYKGDEKEIYLSPAAIGREVFYNKISDIIGDYNSCQDPKNLCPSCRLFGFVNKGKAIASRVRFCDATILSKNDERTFLKEVILSELSSPKPSATEFYLQKPNSQAQLWNYDYAGKKSGKKFESFKGYEAKIQGRKFYWHQKIETPLKIEIEKPTKRNVCIRPLNHHIKFTSKIYFNRITKKELKQLLWVLEIGNRSSNAHKIGMGKPLGLGSIQIIVKDVKIREIRFEENSISYKIDSIKEILDEVHNPQKSEEILRCSPETLESFLIGSDFENAPGKVDYPSNIDEPENFHWFVENRKFGRGTGTNPIINQTLSTNLNKPYLYKYEPCQEIIGKEKKQKETYKSIKETSEKKKEITLSKITFSDSQLEEKGVKREQLEYLTAIYDILVKKQINTNRDKLPIAIVHKNIMDDHKEWPRDKYDDIGFSNLRDAVQSSIDLFKLELQIIGGDIFRNKN